MSTSAILPVSSVSAPSSVDYDSASATGPQQAVFNSILTQLQQSVSLGDLPTSQTLLNAVNAISPSASAGTTPLATFLTSVGSALSNGSASQAQAALAAYQSAVPASSSSTTQTPLVPTANPNVVAAQIAASLVQNENQLLLVNALDNPANLANSNAAAASSSGSNSSSASSLIGILNAAYPASSSSSATPSTSTGATTSSSEATTSASPYDALVSSIQASLAAGDGTLTPALAYLQAAGNFVNTSA